MMPPRERLTASTALALRKNRDIAFGAGRYQPNTTEGRRLLAHELAHREATQSTGKSAACSATPFRVKRRRRRRLQWLMKKVRPATSL